MPAPTGFEFSSAKDGCVRIRHHGRLAATLRGRSAERFLAAMEAGGEGQELMARATGDYRRGNERSARGHPRNRGR